MSQPHETQDAPVWVIGVCAACLAGLIVCGLLLGAWFHAGSFRRLPEIATFQYGPKDRPEIVRAWPALEREFHEHLETYGWVDRKAGIVRIPIEQAMSRLLKENAGKEAK